jgi:hypothetical protein
LIDARIDGDAVEVEATGRDWWPNIGRNTKLARQLTVRLPLEHIKAARIARRPHKHGTFQNHPADGQRDGPCLLIWCRGGLPVLELDMDGRPYEYVALTVPDPERLAEQIRTAAGVRER